MKSKRKHFLALSLAGMGAIGAFASVSAASIQAGIPNKDRDIVRTAIQQAVTSGDYQAYLATTKEYKIGVPVLTEAQFATMVQAHKLRMSGDANGAKKLLDDAKITPPHKGEGKGSMHAGVIKRKDITALTDTQKTAMRQALELRMAGKETEAQTLLTQAGIQMHGKGMGMHKNGGVGKRGGSADTAKTL